jgi:phosphoribosylanthranilate isomerase
MTWIKICGITNLEDALVAVEAGADALGFIFHEKSPRQVQVDEVSVITSQLSVKTERVGVFVGNYPSKELISQAHLSAIQWYPTIHSLNRKAMEALVDLSTKIFYAVSRSPDLNAWPGGRMNFDPWPDRGEAIRAILLDSGTAIEPGGTGVPLDWDKLRPFISDMTSGFNLILAGGLKPDNVGNAMRILHPWGVDVSSGVEAKPGKKDPDKVRAFIKAVREADKANSN